MGPPPDPRVAPADFVVVGASHKTSSAALRDRLFIEPAEEAGVFAALRERGLDEAAVLSTCDRVEVLGIAGDLPAAEVAVRDILEMRLGGDVPEPNAIRLLAGAEAVRYLFAVASSLESVVVGEADVLGQVKRSHERARAHGATGPALDAVFERSYTAAKQVRTETSIAEGPVSLANAAVRAVRNLFGDLSDVSALLVGPGEMGVLMLEHLRAQGLAELSVAAPTPERAASAAHAYGGHALTYEELPARLPAMDLVICAAGTGRVMIDAAMMKGVLRARRRRPVFILDVAVPGDADRDVAGLDDAFLYDLDDLESIARRNRSARELAARDAWMIVESHVTDFMSDVLERDAAGPVRDLRAHFERVRADVLAGTVGQDADEVTRRLINQLLHEPSRALRDSARRGVGENDIEGAARRLFGLDDTQESGDTDPPPRRDRNES